MLPASSLTTKKRAGVKTELDRWALFLRLDDAGEQMKDPAFHRHERCDGLMIITPEYNHVIQGC